MVRTHVACNFPPCANSTTCYVVEMLQASRWHHMCCRLARCHVQQAMAATQKKPPVLDNAVRSTQTIRSPTAGYGGVPGAAPWSMQDVLMQTCKQTLDPSRSSLWLVTARRT